MSEWQPYNGDYEKRFYDLKLKSGSIVKECWPNAGTFHVCKDNSTHKVGAVIEGKLVESIRLTEGQ